MAFTYQPLKHIWYWTQHVIPIVYSDALSMEELIEKLILYLNKAISEVNLIGNQVTINTNDIIELKKELKILGDELEKVKNGDYVSLYIDALAQFIDNNLQQMVGRIVKYVFFGLTDDGYFCAYIPDSWKFISFDTIIDTNDELYGHLLLRW